MIQVTLAVNEIKALVQTQDRSEAEILAALGALARLTSSKMTLRKCKVTALNVAAFALEVWPSAPRYARPRVLAKPNRGYTMGLGQHSVRAVMFAQTRVKALLAWMRGIAATGLGPVDRSIYSSVEDTKVLYALIVGLQKFNLQANRVFTIRPNKDGVVAPNVLAAAGAAWRAGKPFRVIGELDSSVEHKLPGRIQYPGSGSIKDLPSYTRLVISSGAGLHCPAQQSLRWRPGVHATSSDLSGPAPQALFPFPRPGG